MNPWEVPGTPWSNEAQFYNWLRGGFRKAIWNRHPVKTEFKKSKKYRAPIGKPTKKEPDGRTVWAYKCEICNGDFRESDVQVDHIEPSGSLNTVEHIKEFVIRLSFVTFDKLRLLCKECHDAVTYAQRMGISVEEARVEKRVIAVCKNTKECKEWLESKGIPPASNAEARREQVTKKMYEELEYALAS